MPEPESNLNDTIERIFGILTGRRWWILGAACCIPLAVVAVALKLPDRYVSQATLLFVPQQVSQRYVEPDTSSSIPVALQAMKLDVLSSARLLGIVNELGVYATDADKESSAPALIVARMRDDIDIQPLETSPGRSDFTAFTISFTASTPKLAQEVTSRLTSLFIEQNLKTRGEQAANTTKFLSDQLEAAKQRLEEQAQRLQAFKSSNLGELPEQQPDNLAALTDVRERLMTVTASISQAQQQKASIESSLNDRLGRLQLEKTELLSHYTARHPEVIKKDREVGKVQAALERLRTGARASEKSQDSDSPDDPALAGILKQADTNAAVLESLSEQQQKFKAESEQYQKRLNLTPIREQQLAEILRDYDLFKQDYANLQKEKLQSQLTSSLEEHQEGQQFHLAEPASLPVTPSSPKRLKICLGGLAGGVLVGFVLAFLIDTRDRSFHTEKELAQKFSLPLVLGVPLVSTSTERRARTWRVAFEWMAGCVMTLAMLAAEFYVFRKG